MSATVVSDETQTNALQTLRIQVNENESGYVGDMVLDNYRKIFNLTTEANFMDHYVIFSEILEEILGVNNEDASEEQVA
ncbi:MAG: hypothetical protein ACK5LV_11195 [Lachnospirales bacterium]